jgi:hypothetical protein
MNQGATQHQRNATESGLKGVAANEAALAELRGESELMRQHLSEEAMTDLIQKIDLGAPGYFLPRGYEEGNVAAIEYDTASLPDETELRGDLSRFLALYATCVEIKREILANEPGLIKTTANTQKTKPQFKPKPPAFRPKSSAEYRAKIGAHVQVKQRRHEELLNLFETYATNAGLVVANNVHPRDLTVNGNSNHWLIEGKVVGANAQIVVREAIGQLFAYRHFYYRDLARPDPSPVALFTEPVGPALVELLVSLGIEAIWMDGGTWHGRAPDGSCGLLQSTLAIAN